MVNVAMLVPILQARFTTTADQLAREAGFLRRRRGPAGADFLRALTFGYLKRRCAPLEDLAQPLGISPGSPADATAEALAPPLPKGALHLADLGFADFARLRDEDAQGIYWVSRLPAQTCFHPDGAGRACPWLSSCGPGASSGSR